MRTKESETTKTVTELLLIPLDDTVVFPGMTVTLPLDTGDEKHVLLVPRHESEYAKRRRRRRGRRAPAAARRRAARRAVGSPPRRRRRRNPDATGGLRVAVEERPDVNPAADHHRRARARVPRRRRGDPRAARRRRPRQRVRALDHRAGRARRHGGLLARPDLRAEGRAAPDPRRRRASRAGASSLQRERLAELQVRKRIRDDVESGAQKQQREYFLRKQLDSIRKELGEDDASVAERLPAEDRRGRHARRGARAGGARARPPRADGRGLEPRRR